MKTVIMEKINTCRLISVFSFMLNQFKYIIQPQNYENLLVWANNYRINFNIQIPSHCLLKPWSIKKKR